MQHSSFFLRTKLLPPRAASEILKRPRLTERLRSHEDAPVTLIAADAGYGKTTLISDFLRDQSRPFVWYQLDHTDADPIVFLNYVTQGIRGIDETFGDAILAYLAEANEDLVRSPERAADLLINEILMGIEQPFVLVLDDYHHIGDETPVHKIVDRILQYAAEHVHLVITTRTCRRSPSCVGERKPELSSSPATTCSSMTKRCGSFFVQRSTSSSRTRNSPSTVTELTAGSPPCSLYGK